MKILLCLIMSKCYVVEAISFKCDCNCDQSMI